MLDGVQFLWNDAHSGGGACFEGGGPLMTDCVLRGNHATWAGGGVTWEDGCTPRLVRVSLIGAWDVGCTCGPTAGEPMTWGGIKSMYR